MDSACYFALLTDAILSAPVMLVDQLLYMRCQLYIFTHADL